MPAFFHSTPVGQPMSATLRLVAMGAIASSALLTVGCDDDDDESTSMPTETISMRFSGLEDLGPDYVYEGWIMNAAGDVVTGGRFSIDAEGNPVPAAIEVSGVDVNDLSAYILTIEPADETGEALAAPSSTHVLGGDFTNGGASLTVDHRTALGTDFTESDGVVLIATPTTAATDDNEMGYSFLDNSSGSPEPGLTLPTLPDGWVYEGWAVGSNGTPYSTGTFTSVTGADSDGAGPAAGPLDAPPFPGQDFIVAPMDFDLTPSTAVISVEPYPDNSPAPFSIKPLIGAVSADAAGTLVDLGQYLGTLPTGEVSFGTLPPAAPEYPPETISMQFDGLEDLGGDYVYEGWIMNGAGDVVTGGRFSVDGDGNPVPAAIELTNVNINDIAAYILTIEPAVEVGDALHTPSSTHILAGDFAGDTADVDVSHGAALGSDFGNVAGSVLIATPTTTTPDDKELGYWFLDNSSGSPEASLTLPTLPAGWVYEGWAVVGGVPYSTGTFTSVTGADSDGSRAGPEDAPPFPGQDFITPPLDLTPSTAVISIEPYPDNSAAPFAIKPLIGAVGADAAGTLVELGQYLGTLPTGTVSFGELVPAPVFPPATISMNFDGLEDLGADYVYEGWIMNAAGEVVTGGRFAIDGNGDPVPAMIELENVNLNNLNAYILTIEPANELGDALHAPSSTRVLGGDFGAMAANLAVDHATALGTDFSTSAGSVLIATPTTTTPDYNEQGYWFLDNSGSSPQPSLSLPTLPAGWVYEGWAVVGGVPYSTGTFTSVTGADSDGAGSGAGPEAAPPFPGQDFITPALDLTPSTAVISVEPYPDNDPAPFAMKPLVGDVGAEAAGTSVDLGQNLGSLPTGDVTFVVAAPIVSN
jgi:hypothetical protein